MKRIAAIVLALAMIFAFAACGPKPAAPTPTPVPTEAPKSLKIVVVTSPSGVDDGSFNQDVWNGVNDFISTVSKASTVKHVQETTGDTNAAIEKVRDVVADYDVIVTPGFQFAGIGAIAAENPSKLFILVDAFPTDKDGKEVVLSNVYAMQFAENESGFLAGVAAALQTKTNKVAVVNGVAYPSNVNYQWGFESGVHYANKAYGTKAEIVEFESYAGTDVTGANVGGNYVQNFNDEATAKVIGNALIDAGCDVIFVAAGNSGNGVFTAAKEATGVYVIGCDSDQFDDGVSGSKNVVLTSVLKGMALNVKRQLTTIFNETFKGANDTLTAATDSTGFVSATGRQQLTADQISKLNAAFGKLKDGSIIPAANFNGVAPESFK